eukprot:TRINITY_DN3990_c0_g1_i7.p4 TRINITY_DN3990_c0_g1~~TRINITY_DN3990_c0_g1_i7.p4  ORF type:complete len:166 (+),score=57.82 TRINITY_DN3990_c0_g1_i7:753-1250(+)
MIFWLGDNPGHNVYEQAKDSQTKYFEFVVDLLIEAKYKGKVYSVLGNHDCYPPSQFDIYNDEDQWLTETFAKRLEYWFKDDTMGKYGYFSQLFPGTQLRVIGLNSQVNDFANIFLLGNATDPLKQLRWLEGELKKSEANKESVMILGHVGPQSKSGTNCKRCVQW